MPEAIISAKGTEAPTVRSGRFTAPQYPWYEVRLNAGAPLSARPSCTVDKQTVTASMFVVSYVTESTQSNVSLSHAATDTSRRSCAGFPASIDQPCWRSLASRSSSASRVYGDFLQRDGVRLMLQNGRDQHGRLAVSPQAARWSIENVPLEQSHDVRDIQAMLHQQTTSRQCRGCLTPWTGCLTAGKLTSRA